MLKLIAEDFIAPEHIAKVLPLYRELLDKTRQEAGCIRYELCHDLREQGHFVFIETWQDYAALDAHVASEHFQRLVPQIDQYSYKAGRFTHLQAFTEVSGSIL
ncbi:putative quinol monooxygenase [Pseudomonas sp. F1_0610]|uniref:putative quinol monooxygenase n=1 Tax=Pseudomonas sp. F1_0610 TaxID=3114284 RepID=UPI0039C4DA3E